MLIMAFTVSSFIPVSAQIALGEKQAQKAAKKEAKKLSKEKWEYSGAMDLETLLFTYYMKLKEYGGNYANSDIVLNDVKSMRKGQQIMLNDVQARHAQKNGANAQTEATGNNGDSEYDNNKYSIRGSYNFFGDVQEAFVLYRKNKNGTYDLKGYYLVDTNSPQSRNRALDNDIDMSEKISKSIRGEENEE